MRLTLDTHTDSAGETNVRLKYAYNIQIIFFPQQEFEFGQAHRPWIDYEEHSGVAISVQLQRHLVEGKTGEHTCTNSAD